MCAFGHFLEGGWTSTSPECATFQTRCSSMAVRLELSVRKHPGGLPGSDGVRWVGPPRGRPSATVGTCHCTPAKAADAQGGVLRQVWGSASKLGPYGFISCHTGTTQKGNCVHGSWALYTVVHEPKHALKYKTYCNVFIYEGRKGLRQAQGKQGAEGGGGCGGGEAAR